MSRWLVDAITLAYSSLGLQCPFVVRAHSAFLGMVQQGVLFRCLWGSRLVLAVHICTVLQPGCPCFAGQSRFCLSSNLTGSLDQHCSSPSFAWSIHNYMDARYHLQDDTQATDDPQGSPCAWCILLTPLGLIPLESWFWVVPRHRTVWLDWFPYKHRYSTQYEWNIERERTRLLS